MFLTLTGSYLINDVCKCLTMSVVCLLDSANADALVSSSDESSEIVFMGTGTSEGIPRVSCLTNPLKTCSVFFRLF